MWHYIVNEKPAGPVSGDELERLALSGEITSGTLVRREGISEWKPFLIAAGTCGECAALFGTDEMVHVNGVSVCAACKPIFLQKVAENVASGKAHGVQLASRWQRLGGSLIDGLSILVILFPLQYTTGAIERRTAAAGGLGFAGLLQIRWEDALWTVLGFIVILAMNWKLLGAGQTIGKWVLRTRIVRKDGTPCIRSRIIVRRMLPLFALSMIPLISIVVSYVDSLFIFRPSRCTLHDDVADTKVIDLR
jgi:uncharacterized RDD family membrane protein YckC